MRTHRLATEADLPALRALMALAIDTLQADFLSPEAVAASRQVMGLDTRLIADRTYFMIEEDGVLAGCGGWSRRATLYGGDHTAGVRDDALLDSRRDAARTRAMYTHPAFARRGIGATILRLCEAAARAEGFGAMQLMATAAGLPLYRACGYRVVIEQPRIVDGVIVPLSLMEKVIARGSFDENQVKPALA